MSKKVEFGDEKLTICSLKLTGVISRLRSATSSDLYLQMKSFLSFLDEAPEALIKDFLDSPELHGVWKSLLEKHSVMLLARELAPLPKFSGLTQLIGLYKCKLALLQPENSKDKLDIFQQAMEQGSINAMICLGDIYIDRIRERKETVNLEKLFDTINCFANAFLTPGHIIAADIYLAAWAVATTCTLYFNQAIYHLCLAEILLKKSAPQIRNAYGEKDFESASKVGAVFRSEDYKGYTISQYIAANLQIFSEQTYQTISIQPIMQKARDAALKINADESKEIKHTTKLPNLEEFFMKKFKNKSDPLVIEYLLKKSPLLGLATTSTQPPLRKDISEAGLTSGGPKC